MMMSTRNPTIVIKQANVIKVFCCNANNANSDNKIFLERLGQMTTENQEYKDYISSQEAIYNNGMNFHLAVLAASRDGITDASGFPSFQQKLREVRDILLILETTRNSDLVPLNKAVHDTSSGSDEFWKHPHWQLALEKILRELYPAALPIIAEPIQEVFIPMNIVYDLLQRGLKDTANLEIMQDHLEDPTILYTYLGDQSVTTSDYLAAFQFNLMRLRSQKQKEIEGSLPPHHAARRNTPAEAAIYYVATNIGIQRAIKYLESLWNNGWLHNVYLYSELWLGLQMWCKSNPPGEIYRKGRQEYVKEILFFSDNASLSGSELLITARGLLQETKEILSEERRKSVDLSEWLRCSHKHWLSFTGISILNSIAKNKDVKKTVSTELTQIWRYCMEATADIEMLINNPFKVPLLRMLFAIALSTDERDLRRKLRTFNYGRIVFPEVMHERIMTGILEKIRERATREHMERFLSDTILSSLDKGLQEVYTLVYPLAPSDADKRDLPDGSSFSTDQDDNYQHLSPKSTLMAQSILGLRHAQLQSPISGHTLPYSVKLDITTQLRLKYRNGNVIEVSLVDKSDEKQDTIVKEKQNDGEKEKEMELELRKTEKMVEWLEDVLMSLGYVEEHSRMDLRALEKIFIDIVSSWCVLCLQLEDGMPQSFHIIPRRFIETDQKGILEGLEARLSGVSGTGLFVLLQRKKEFLFRNKPINEIPIRATFAVTDSGHLTMELKA